MSKPGGSVREELDSLPAVSRSKIKGNDQAIPRSLRADIEATESRIETIGCVRWRVHYCFLHEAREWRCWMSTIWRCGRKVLFKVEYANLG